MSTKSPTSPTQSVRNSATGSLLYSVVLSETFRAATFLVLVTVLAYLPALRDGFIWDDDAYVTGNPTLRSLDGLRQIWFTIGAVPQYYPLVHTTFWLEYHLWGLNPLGYHLVNILLHAGVAVLLWSVLKRLKLAGALLAAAIFALHPVQVESVAWITERKNVLSAIFYLAAALSYLRFVELKDAGVRNGGIRLIYAGALLLFVAALWSKTITCSLPAALLLVRWWQRGQLRRGDIAPLLPFFAVGAGLGLLTVWVEKHMVGAVGAPWALNFSDRCLIAGRALWFYASKIVCPVNLTFIYPHWNVNTAVWWQWLYPAMALLVAAVLWILRNRFGRGPLAAVLFFALTLSPAIGFVDVYPFRYSFVADHFQYLACIGLMVLTATGLSRLPLAANIVLLMVLGVLTWRQTHIYRDAETLWRDTLTKNPSCAIAHNNLGTLLSARGRSAEAEQHYREALRLESNDAETMSNLGVSLAEQGQTEQALQLLRKAVALDPNDAEACCNLGKVLAKQDQYSEAILCFHIAIRLKPRQAAFYYNLGCVLASLGKLDEAIGQFQQALELGPDYADAHNNLGLVLARESRYPEAVQQYAEALRINPDHALAHNNLGEALMRLRNLDAAMAHFLEALRLDPDYANAHYNLGNALALQGKYEEAAAQFSEAVRLAPDFVPAHRNLGLALERLGRHEEAIQQFKEALRLDPSNKELQQRLRALEVQVPQ